MSISVVGAIVVGVALLNVGLTLRRAARGKVGKAPIVFSLGTLALAIAVAANLVPPSFRWIGGAAVEVYLLLVAVRALRGGDTNALAGFLPAPMARLTRTELQLIRLAARAPGLIAGTRQAGPATYSQTSKWESFAVIVLVALVPDGVVLAFIPMPLWLHVVAIALSVYSTMWVLGAYGSIVTMPHELTDGRRIFHNGVFGTIDASAVRITGARVLSRAERTNVVRHDAGARSMFCPGAPMVAVAYDGEAELTPLLGPARTLRGTMYVPSDVPDQLAHLLTTSPAVPSVSQPGTTAQQYSSSAALVSN